MVRVRFGYATGVLDVATEELHRRVISGVGLRVFNVPRWRELAANDSEVVAEASAYFWDKFLRDTQDVCNAEVRFKVYLDNRVDDYMRHLSTEENTRNSIDGMAAVDDDGNKANFIDMVEDLDGELPVESIIREQESAQVMSALMALPRKERNAFYFRVECRYDWSTVADFLGCSIPTARKLVKSSLEKLLGVLK